MIYRITFIIIDKFRGKTETVLGKQLRDGK